MRKLFTNSTINRSYLGSAGTEPLSYGVVGVDLVEYDESTWGPSEDKEIPSLDLENAGS